MKLLSIFQNALADVLYEDVLSFWCSLRLHCVKADLTQTKNSGANIVS